jgi:hypothetical protein
LQGTRGPDDSRILQVWLGPRAPETLPLGCPHWLETSNCFQSTSSRIVILRSARTLTACELSAPFPLRPHYPVIGFRHSRMLTSSASLTVANCVKRRRVSSIFLSARTRGKPGSCYSSFGRFYSCCRCSSCNCWNSAPRAAPNTACRGRGAGHPLIRLVQRGPTPLNLSVRRTPPAAGAPPGRNTICSELLPHLIVFSSEPEIRR